MTNSERFSLLNALIFWTGRDVGVPKE